MPVPSRPPAVRRPALSPALTRVWRSGDRLQLGLTSDPPVLVEGLDAHDLLLLDALDGRRDRAAVLALAADLGVPPARAVRLLDLLEAADCLGDAASDASALQPLDPAARARVGPDLAALSLLPPRSSLGRDAFARRRRSAVEVHGAGRAGAAVAHLLAAAGVGTVSVVDDGAVRLEDVAPMGPGPSHVGRPRSDAAVESARRTAPEVARDLEAEPDLVVLAGGPVVDPSRARALLSQGLTHLPLTVLETTATVGPLVAPGRGPCLDCVDLHRTDRDPEWPLVAAQLVSRTSASAGADDVVLATAAAGLAALTVLAWLDAAPEVRSDRIEPGTAYILRLPGGRPRRRTYPCHPRCGCAWGESH